MRSLVFKSIAIAALLALPARPAIADEPPPPSEAKAQQPPKPTPEQDAAPRKPMIYAEQLDAWERMEREGMMNAFLASGEHNENRDKVYTALIRSYANSTVRETIGKQAAKIREASIKSIRSGFDDPLARIFVLEASLSTARAANKSPTPQEIEGAEKALLVLRERGYPPVRLWMWSRLISISKSVSKMDRSEIAASVRATEEAFVAAATAAASDPFLEQYLIRLLMADLNDDTAPRYTTSFTRLLDDSGASTWMKNTAAGVWHAENAWKLRGDTYGPNDAQQAGFEEQLDNAEARFTEAYRADPSRPEPAARMIQVRGGHGDQEGMADWFELATKAQFDYIRAYDTMTWFLRPRWSGSHDKMFAFAERCLATNRFDTLIPGRYLKILAAIASDKEEFTDALSRPGIPEHLEKIRAGYAAGKFGGAYFANSQVAVCYWRMGRFADARTLHAELGDHFDTFALSEWRVLPEEFATVHAYEPATRELVQSADKAIQDGHPENAADLFEEAIAAAPDDGVRRAVRMKAAMNRFRMKYDSGEWTPIAGDPDAALLFVPGSVTQGFEYKPENRITVNSKHWYAMAVFLPRLGPAWEIRGTIVVAPGSDNQDFAAGISLYVDTDADAKWDSWTWQDLLVLPELRMWRIGRSNEDRKPVNVGLTRFALRAQCWNDEVVVKVDGETVLADDAPGSRTKTSDRVALHLFDCTPRPDAVTYDSFEVRRLSKRPAELVEKDEKQRMRLRENF